MNSPSTSRIALGTAQFGLPYGISNASGQISRSEGAAILSLGHAAGIRMLDTAMAYGDSEKTLGSLGTAGWEIVTKLPPLPSDPGAVADWIEAQLDGSLARLGTPSVHGLLLHRPLQLLDASGSALYRALLAQRDRGRVAKIGISVYGPDELDRLPHWMKFDIVQAPLSVIDARMIRSGWAERLQQAGCEFHARSIFLQGLLLMSPAARPATFERWNNLWQQWDAWLAETRLSPVEACVRHALAAPGVSRLVIGVDSAAQLAAILSAIDGGLAPLPDGLACNDPVLLNPSQWKTT